MGLQAWVATPALLLRADGICDGTHASNLRGGTKMGNTEFVDTVIKDGKRNQDAFNGYLRQAARDVAKKWQITREQQDELPLHLRTRRKRKQKAGKFKDEIAPVGYKSRKGDVTVEVDEYPKPGVTAESLSGLRPAFDKEGTVTAGNASGINDGAAAMVLMSEDEATNREIEPMARIVSGRRSAWIRRLWGSARYQQAVAPSKSGWSVDDLDLVEANEAFAAQACAVNKDLGWDPGKVNVNGGAIAIGHPIGASGARVLTTLLYEMQKRDAKKGLATLCIGGGMGIAMCVERD